ncbi:hypothetical protein PPROV_000916900 [Pycnococcus provasolii]|uniref:Uncharacterized protein n=1 Tax=Pycnococcus provasolii TaxID=41880 RepID=A0A830HTY5_9CHLO|nr:hypothetical protein PPROV_000916900 [Pycnococcus provasolii]
MGMGKGILTSPHGHNITLVSPPYTVHARKVWPSARYLCVTDLQQLPALNTEFIVNERGHLVKGMKRPHTAFVRPTTFHTNERWPVMSTFVSGGSSHTLVGVGSSATMGYKGIPSTYLPMGSVPIRTTSTCPGGFKPAHSHFFV